MSSTEGLQDLAVSLARRHPGDAARELESLPGEVVSAFLATATEEVAAAVLGRMATTAAAHYLELLDVGRAAVLLRHRLPQRAAALLRTVTDDSHRQAILAAMPAAAAQPVRAILSFPTGSVGASMRPGVASVPDDVTVAEARDRLRSHRQGAVPYVYVVERSGRLLAATTFASLLTAPPEARIVDVASPVEGRLSAAGLLRDVAAHPGWLRHAVLPVVDGEGMLLGALEYRTLLRLRRGEQETAGVAPVAAALGELYQIGLTGILRAAAGVQEPPEGDGGRR